MKKKETKQNNKYLILIIIVLLGINVVLSTILILNRTNGSDIISKCDNEKTTAKFDFKEIDSIINNKEDGIIYYYNSNSNKKINKEIKKYLDELKINYYAYDDVDVNKEDYVSFLSKLNIDKDIFGVPAIIYIRDGEMYANIINIDNKEVVKQFIDDYDLYTIK